MDISKETVLERKRALEQDRDQAMANANALAGAAQDCQHWLDEIEKEEPEGEAAEADAA